MMEWFQYSDDHGDWTEQRRLGLGGTDTVALLGLTKYRTPLEVYLSKTAPQPPGTGSAPGDPAIWGLLLEPVIAEVFAARHPDWQVLPAPRLLTSEQYPWLVASLDRVLVRPTGERGPLEVKTRSQWKAGDWKDGVPLQTLVQLTHYMLVAGADFGQVAVLIGGQDYREYEVPLDPALADRILTVTREFWARIVRREPPEPTGTAAETAAVLAAAAALPVRLGEQHPLSAAGAQAAARVLEVRDAIRHLEEQEQAEQGRLKAEMDGAERLVSDAYTVRWAPFTQARVDLPALRLAEPALVAKHTVAVQGRRFTVTKTRTS